VYYHLADGFRN